LIQKDRRSLERRLGDLLFAIVRLGQCCDLDAEESLRQRTGQFIHRFDRMEKLLADRGLLLQQCSPEELQELWRETEADAGRQPTGKGKP
jgi:nucleoside triphosphate diphosphatase